jgi:hypothetical protein
MANIEDDLGSFTQFVHERVEGESDLKLPELFDLWLLQNPVDIDYAENVAAINASINDFMNGERGTRAGAHSRELRQEFGISDE